MNTTWSKVTVLALVDGIGCSLAADPAEPSALREIPGSDPKSRLPREVAEVTCAP